MIQDLRREIVGEFWVERIDLASGERVDTSFVSPKHENRESDVIWKFRRPRWRRDGLRLHSPGVPVETGSLHADPSHGL
jgi:hypothetical protein